MNDQPFSVIDSQFIFSQLLAPQSFDRIEAGRPHGRVDAKDQARQQAEAKGQGQGVGIDNNAESKARNLGQPRGDPLGQAHADQPTQKTEHQRFNQEL